MADVEAPDAHVASQLLFVQGLVAEGRTEAVTCEICRLAETVYADALRGQGHGTVICFFFRGASIQFDEKPANVIVNSTDASESDGKDDDGDEEGEGGTDATSEE